MEALKLIINHVKSRPMATELLLTHSDSVGNVEEFYRKCGFEYTGKSIDDELVISLKL